MTVAHQAPLFMEFSRQEYWSGLPFPSPGDLPDPGLRHCGQILCRLNHHYCCSVAKLCQTLWRHALKDSRLPCPSLSLSLLKLVSIESVMLPNHLILCCPLLFLPSVFPSIRFFSSELAFHIRWPKYWSFSFSISPSSEYSGLISFRMFHWGWKK